MVEGARLESVFRGNSNVGSNPTLSAMPFKTNKLLTFLKLHHGPLSRACFVFGMSDMQFCKAQVRSVKAKSE